MPRGYKGTLEERLWRKISPEPNSGCWLWTGCCNHQGYGHTYSDGRVVAAYRATYELYVGKIPDGMVIDHLCRNSYCVNPDHLEPVTQGENVRRGLAGPYTTHCKRGHVFDQTNMYVGPTGARACRACLGLSYKRPANRARKLAYMKEYNKRKRAAAVQCT